MSSWGKRRVAGWRRPVAAVVASAIAVVGGAAAGVAAEVGITPASAAPPPLGLTQVNDLPADELNTMWNAYGDEGGHWTGADSTVSVPLPDGRIAWLFSDTFLGTVNEDHSRPTDTPMVNNTLVLQEGTSLTATLHGGTAEEPRSLVDTGVSDEMYWVADGVVVGDTLQVLYNRQRKTGDGGLDFELLGTSLATFALPELTLTDVTPLPLGSEIAWGTTILDDSGQTYVYGIEHAEGIKFAHVARANAGLSNPWEFWNGSGWSASETDSARLMSGVGGYSVDKIGDEYVIVSQDTNTLFGPSVVAHTGPTPTGPFGPPQYLFDAPEPAANPGHIIYDARTHPSLAPSGKLLISYNVNSLRSTDNFDDVRIYRPRFVEVPWPFPTPDPDAVPARPTGLTIEGDSDPIRLSWTEVGGATGYRIYQRDVTAGQTHFARQARSVSEPSTELVLLSDSHTYEFRVTAENAAGESQFSNTASVTIHVAPPPTPADLAAVPDDNGEIALSWSPVVGPAQYHLYLRDVTMEQTEFVPVETDGAFATTATARRLAHDHEYEFVVTASNGGGESPQSAPVRARAQYALPAVPTGLTATAGTDGTIHLEWQSSGDDVWYWVYQRDITGGEVDFTKLEYPVTVGPEFTAGFLIDGHEYEFKISAINGGGEGPATSPVQATARYSVPDAPAGLEAVANPDASVTLTWNAPSGDGLWYWVYQRDVTGGEADFTKLEYPVTEGTTAQPGGLIPGHVYEFTVSAINAGGEGPTTSAVRVTARHDKPDAPTDLQAASNGDGSVSLTWTAPAPDLYYWVYQRDVTAGEEEFQRLALPVTEGASARPGGLTNGHEYEFAVAGINGAGTGPRSEPVRVTAHVDPPTAPTGLQATTGDGQVELTWTAPDEDLWYWVYYRDVTAGDTEFLRAAYPTTEGPQATLGLLINGHDYEFKVTAVNAGGEGPTSAVVPATPMPPLPARVTGLTATANDAGEIALSWTAPGPDLYYWIYQRDVTAGETEFTQLDYPATDTAYTAAGLEHEHVYEFKVAGTNLAGDGPESEPVQATAHYALPAAPTNLRGQTAGDGTIALTWDAPAEGLWFWIYQRDVTAGESDFTRSTYPATTPSASTGALVHGHVYEFTVSAINGGGEGPTSEPVRITARGGLPEAPTGLVTTAGDGEVELSWTASPTGNVYYWVYYRKADSANGFTRLELPASSPTATVGGLTNGRRYEFKVTATNASGDSPPSNIARARPMPPAPTAPTGLGAIADNGKVGLGWEMNPTAERYNIYLRDVTAGQTAWRRHSHSPAEWWHTVGGLTNGHEYQFRVTSVNLSGESAPSNVVSATPVPPRPNAPTGLTATAGNGEVRLSWNASSTPNVYYWVYYRPQGQSSWYYYPHPTTRTSFTAKPLWNGFRVDFKVTAANLGGQSGFSNVASATPFHPPPAAPSGLRAVAGNGKVTLTWNASSTPNVFYWVFFRPQGHSGWYYFQYPASGTRFVATGLLNGFRYDFKVTAANEGGQSGFSNTVSATPFVPRPAAPSNLRATAGDGKVTLRWDASSTPNVHYWVYFRPLPQSNWYYFPRPTSGTRYVAKGLLNGFRYEFKVTAANAGGQSGYTNTVSARPLPPPPTPPRLLGAYSWPGHITVTWSCADTPDDALVWLQYRTNGSWHTHHVFHLCDQLGVNFPTDAFSHGTSFQFRVVAERIIRSTSNVVSGSTLWSVRKAYVRMTSATSSGHSWFWRGKQGHAFREPGYGMFDWTDDGCSYIPDLAFGPACVRHDFGYGNHEHAGLSSESHRYRIDSTQLWDMRNICARHGWLDEAICLALANDIFNGLRLLGWIKW